VRSFITCYYDERKQDKTVGNCGIWHGREGNGKAEGKEWWVDLGIDGTSINIMLRKLGGSLRARML